MSTSKREKERQTAQENTLMSLGFTQWEAEKLRRISMTLNRWYELECGDDYGCIERDEQTDKPYWLNSRTMKRSPIADREKGAKKRLFTILGNRNTREWVKTGTHSVKQVAITAYLQTDPRGAALYLIRPSDVLEGVSVESSYNRGICVY